MIENIVRILESLESGKMTRRQAATCIAATTAMVVAGGAPRSASPNPTFRVRGLNHLALRVTDVERSRDFYQRHLGMTVTRDNSPSNCFMGCGDNFVALFRSTSAGMHHYCYTIDDYDADEVEATLRQAGFESDRQENRVYFEDPDGLTVQLAGK